MSSPSSVSNDKLLRGSDYRTCSIQSSSQKLDPKIDSIKAAAPKIDFGADVVKQSMETLFVPPELHMYTEIKVLGTRIELKPEQVRRVWEEVLTSQQRQAFVSKLKLQRKSRREKGEEVNLSSDLPKKIQSQTSFSEHPKATVSQEKKGAPYFKGLNRKEQKDFVKQLNVEQRRKLLIDLGLPDQRKLLKNVDPYDQWALLKAISLEEKQELIFSAKLDERIELIKSLCFDAQSILIEALSINQKQQLLWMIPSLDERKAFLGILGSDVRRELQNVFSEQEWKRLTINPQSNFYENLMSTY